MDSFELCHFFLISQKIYNLCVSRSQESRPEFEPMFGHILVRNSKKGEVMKITSILPHIITKLGDVFSVAGIFVD